MELEEKDLTQSKDTKRRHFRIIDGKPEVTISYPANKRMNLYEITLEEVKMEICGDDAEDAKDAIIDWLDNNTVQYTIKAFIEKGTAW